MNVSHRNRVFLFLLFAVTSMASSASPQNQTISQHFNEIKNNPEKLKTFLERMPKGGDLHNHLSGSVYAENLIHFGATKGLCLNPKTDIVSQESPCEGVSLPSLTPKTPLYQKVIDAWSLRRLNRTSQEDHDHFFAIFQKIAAISQQQRGDLLADAVTQAANQQVGYLELMLALDNGQSGQLARSLSPKLGLRQLYAELKTPAFERMVQESLQRLDSMEKQKSALLHCDTSKAAPGCGVQVRYLAEAYRNQPRAQFFAQLLTEFELSRRDSRVVGVNLVGPEDGPLSLKDYLWQMRALHFLHQHYPNTHISLHAGELRADAMVAHTWRDHIQSAIEIGHAERIGHGTAVMQENQANQLMSEMKNRQIPVEINLTSNAKILHISGGNHPAPVYLQHHVPIVLSTDDAGIFRTNLTEEYVSAVQQYGWTYEQIKTINRNSVTYSFLPGPSLWSSSACRSALDQHTPAPTCDHYLSKSEKAQAEWALEQRLSVFEREIVS